MSDDLATISSRISSFEAGHRVSLPTPCEEVSDLIYMALGSQEATFLSEDEHEEGKSSMARVAHKGPLAAHVPLASPPRLKKTSSIFETSCGLVQDKPNTFGSFPESNHASAAIQFVNDYLSVKMYRNAQVALTPCEVELALRNSRLAVERELRIALVGKTGVGKSATANTISGGDYFESGECGQSLTQICQQKKVTRFGQDICIIDTPGIFDTETDQNTVETEIKRCVYLGAPGLHAILYVMEVGRFRKEDLMAIQTFLGFFEEEMKSRVIVVFTHGDKLLKKKQTLRDYLLTIPESLKTFLESCENRVILFNNDFNERQSCEQVSCILMMIEALKKSNEFSFYCDARFKKAEERIRQREEVIRQEIEMEYNEKMEEFKRTTEIRLRMEIMQEKVKKEIHDEVDKSRAICNKRFLNVREEVRDEIKSNKSKCTIM